MKADTFAGGRDKSATAPAGRLNVLELTGLTEWLEWLECRRDTVQKDGGT